MQNRTLASLSGAPNSFNTIRLLAATLVIFSHAFPITGQAEPLEGFTGQATVGDLAVSIFFMISGFLIPASLDRGSVARYVVKRACRIIPGLVISVLVTAFCFGLAFTQLPAGEYLLHPQTWRFLANGAMLPVGYDLPGVFVDQPVRAANGSLWSLKFEMACYVFVVAAFAIARLRKAAVVAAWLASMVLAPMLTDHANGMWYFLQQGVGLFRFFGIGMVFYLFADRIPVRSDWGWLANGLVLISGFTPYLVEVTVVAGSYAIVTIAYSESSWFRQLTAKGDISYGVYVYAFPMQQALLPVSLTFAVPWLANALLALPLIMLAGLLSWLLVEKPALAFGRTLARKIA